MHVRRGTLDVHLCRAAHSTSRAYNIPLLPRVMWRGPVRSITRTITLPYQCDRFGVGRWVADWRAEERCSAGFD